MDDTQPAKGNLEEDYIQKALARQTLQNAAALDSPYREVFFLRLEGFNFRQIGTVMEKSENWARVTYFRAKAKILEGTEGDNG